MSQHNTNEQTLTFTRDQVLAIIQQAIGPALVPALDFLLSCEASDAHQDACRTHNDAETERNPKVGEVWVSKGVGNAATVVKLDGEFVEYRYHLSTETSRLSLDVFTDNFFLPNV
jgi:hypothetical protein